jgi:hypothetical protein
MDLVKNVETISAEHVSDVLSAGMQFLLNLVAAFTVFGQALLRRRREEEAEIA